MTNIRPAFFALLAVAIALFGYGAARGVGAFFRTDDRETSAPQAATTVARKSSTTPPPARLPPMNFHDQAGFDACVAELQKSGLSEHLAKWLAISAKVRSDLPGSLAFAQKANRLGLWGTAVAMFDPRGGFEFVSGARGNGVSWDTTTALMPYFSTLGRTNPELGLEQLRTASPANMISLTQIFFGNWARIDPDRALDAISQLETRSMRRGAWNGVFGEWGHRDAEGMMRWASDNSPQMARTAFQTQIYSLGQADPAALFELAREYPEAAEGPLFLNFASNFASRGAEGFALIAQFPPGRTRDRMISTFGSRFARMDPKAAWELARSLSAEDRKNFLSFGTPRSLAEVAPQEMAQLALAAPDESHGNVAEVVSAWGRKNPRAAIDWSRQNLTGSNLVDSIEAVFGSWGANNPAEAAVAMEGFPPSMKARLVQNLAGGWAARDPAAAFDYAQKLAPIDRFRAVSRVIDHWASSDPSAAANALVALPAFGFDDAYRNVGAQFAKKNPEQAMKWGTSISDPGMSAIIVRVASEEWAGRDAAAASAFAESMPPGDLRDSAAAGLATSLTSLDPESAAAWANAIAAPTRRQGNLRGVLQSWKDKDRRAATTFVQTMEPGPLRDEMTKLVNGK
jgi:hypothetical protein